MQGWKQNQDRDENVEWIRPSDDTADTTSDLNFPLTQLLAMWKTKQKLTLGLRHQHCIFCCKKLHATLKRVSNQLSPCVLSAFMILSQEAATRCATAMITWCTRVGKGPGHELRKQDERFPNTKAWETAVQPAGWEAGPHGPTRTQGSKRSLPR